MAISQPTYPTTTSALVSHVGTYTDSRESTHNADTTSVHGIADTSVLATDAEVATAVSTHSADTSSVHGINDTTVLATDAEVASAVSTHAADTTAVHGLSDVARAVGSCVYSGVAYPARPTGYATVIWIGPTDPGGSSVDNDMWVPTA